MNVCVRWVYRKFAFIIGLWFGELCMFVKMICTESNRQAFFEIKIKFSLTFSYSLESIVCYVYVQNQIVAVDSGSNRFQTIHSLSFWPIIIKKGIYYGWQPQKVKSNRENWLSKQKVLNFEKFFISVEITIVYVLDIGHWMNEWFLCAKYMHIQYPAKGYMGIWCSLCTANLSKSVHSVCMNYNVYCVCMWAVIWISDWKAYFATMHKKFE